MDKIIKPQGLNGFKKMIQMSNLTISISIIRAKIRVNCIYLGIYPDISDYF